MVDDSDAGDEFDRIFEGQRQLALEEIRAWIDTIPKENREQPHRIVGDRVFTPIETLREIEEATSYGRVFIEQLTAQRLELAKRVEEIDAERRRLED
jgi:hypothetical protein